MKRLVLSMSMAGVFVASSALAKTSRTINVEVTEKGFVPSTIEVKKSEDITLNVTRKTNSTCARQIQVPSLKIKEKLPLNTAVQIKLGLVGASEIKFGCGMNMMIGGVILVN